MVGAGVEVVVVGAGVVVTVVVVVVIAVVVIIMAAKVLERHPVELQQFTEQLVCELFAQLLEQEALQLTV